MHFIPPLLIGHMYYFIHFDHDMKQHTFDLLLYSWPLLEHQKAVPHVVVTIEQVLSRYIYIWMIEFMVLSSYLRYHYRRMIEFMVLSSHLRYSYRRMIEFMVLSSYLRYSYRRMIEFMVLSSYLRYSYRRMIEFMVLRLSKTMVQCSYLRLWC